MPNNTCDYPTIDPVEAGSQPPGPVRATFCWPVSVAVLLTVLTVGVAILGGVIGSLIESTSVAAQWGPTATAAVVGAVLIGAYGLIALAVVGSARNSGAQWWEAVRLYSTPAVAAIAIGLSVGFAARFATAIYSLLLEALGIGGAPRADPTKILPVGTAGLVLTIVVVCVVAPIVEEMVFRGVLLQSLARRWGVTAGIVISSIVFALAHSSLYAALPIFLLALFLGRLFVRSGTLWQPIAAHAAFNTLGLLGVYWLRATGKA